MELEHFPYFLFQKLLELFGINLAESALCVSGTLPFYGVFCDWMYCIQN